MLHHKARKNGFGVVNSEAIVAHNQRILEANLAAMRQNFEPITEPVPLHRLRTKKGREEFLTKAEEVVSRLESGELQCKTFVDVTWHIGVSTSWLRKNLYFYNRVKAVFDRNKSAHRPP